MSDDTSDDTSDDMSENGEARLDVSFAPWSSGEAPLPDAATVAAAVPHGVLLAPRPYAEGRVEPEESWELTAAWGRARGTADVHPARGTPGRTALVRPMVFADGFGHGPSDLPALYGHFRELFDALRASGVDVVLLGFAERQASLQANAGVAVSCVRKAVARQSGYEPLTVGGVGMGGLVTRYALARMEHDGEDHRAGVYLSYDVPHNGAVIPLLLQQLAYFFEALDPGGDRAQAALVRSPAAQQLLWGWVPGAATPGPVATASPLRAEFLRELRRVGWFPRVPHRFGVANGSGLGTGREVPPDAPVLDWTELAGQLQAVVRTQPAYGEGRFTGRMRGLDEWRSVTTSHVPPFDGAPGGTLESYGLLADALGAKVGNDAYRHSCFVPAVSAVALDHDPVSWPVDLYEDISALPPERSELDAFLCDTENSEHGAARPALTDWILRHLT
ncbi:hypothetical protein [Streptomyces sp. NPDC048172]|uniref:hypothetical protein n=1 Tax=Streptomyces sp. NPDC048172 TaxID=3365505 RepID=UPI003710E628